jgi:hypothetical protein
METTRTDGDLIALALEKFKRGAPYGVAAVLDRDITEPDRDGVLWRLLVTDGSTHRWVTAGITRTRGGYHGMAPPADLEDEVEHKAGSYPRETRLADLAADSPHWFIPDRIAMLADAQA